MAPLSMESYPPYLRQDHELLLQNKSFNNNQTQKDLVTLLYRGARFVSLVDLLDLLHGKHPPWQFCYTALNPEVNRWVILRRAQRIRFSMLSAA